MRALVALSFVSLLGCVEDSRSSSGQPIVNGQPDHGDPAVVYLGFDSGGGGGWGCSGTLISPHVVLTAQHCVDGAVGGKAFFGHDPDGAGTWISIKAMTGHASADIGMVALTSPGPATPIPVNDRNLQPYLGQQVRIVGFGATGEDEPGGTKRQGTSVLNSLQGSDMIIAYDGPSATCYGDSGGPYFMTFHGVEHVAGVTSWGVAPCGTPPQGGTRADLVYPWIQAFVDQHGGGGDDDEVRLVARHSGKCLDVASAGITDGTNIQQWTCNGTGAQVFRREDVGNGFVRLRNPSSGKCVDVAGSSTADGANIQLWTCNGTGAQAFKLEDRGGGYYRLRNQTSNRCADVEAARKTDGANVLQWTCHDGLHQQWRLEGL